MANFDKKLIAFGLTIIVLQISQAQITRGPYLQSGTPNSIIIRWRTDIAGNSMVRYGLSADNLALFTGNASSVTDHEIQLTGLSPDTKYFYSIGSFTQVLQADTNNFFKTAPVVGAERKIRALVTGDCGNNSTNQKNVRDQFLNYAGTNYTDLWLLLGDNAYNSGTDAEYQTNFFEIYKDKLLKQTVLWPSPGNHDYANDVLRMDDHAIPYYDIFTLPSNVEAGGVASNSKAFYSYNYGNAHFISLDSYGKEGNTYRLYDTLGPQVAWLKQDLAANTQKWTIVYWHHPPYTLASHNSDTESELIAVRQNLLPILERYKVDLVLCGHSHGYERSKLLKGHYATESSFNDSFNISQSSGKYDSTVSSCPYVKNKAASYDGTVYVVAGSSGQLSNTVQNAYPHSAMYYSNVSNGGCLLLEIEANRLDAKWICEDGIIRDKFTIEKDVNIKKNISIIQGSTVSLTASWIGDYNWAVGAATKSITVNPANDTTYIVTDGAGCLADTFVVTVIFTKPAMKIYPNPAIGNVTIEITTVEGHVILEVYTIEGKKIKTLLNEYKVAGNYKYYINTTNETLSAGMYAVRLTIGKEKIVKKLFVAP